MTVFDGVTINGLHTYKDFQLYKVGEFDWGFPDPKRELVDIPGRDGALDFSTAATGEIKYSNRQCVLNFKARVNSGRQPEFMARISNAFNGVYVEAIDDAEPEWTYHGLATVTFPQKDNWQIYVTIAIDAEPYKLENNQTILTVSPSDFAAETIALGVGKENQKPNSIFTFGTKDRPELNLEHFVKLQFWWTDEQTRDATLQIVDGDGETFTIPINEQGGAGFYWLDLPISDITGIDQTRVYRILCQNRALVWLDGYTQASASIMAHVERMTVVPIWTTTAVMTVLINGREFELPLGGTQNYNIRLMKGENQISFISDSANESVQIQYQNGRL